MSVLRAGTGLQLWRRMKLMSFVLIALAVAPAFAEQRFLGGFYTNGQRVLEEVDAPLTDKLIVIPPGHQPNPDLKLPASTHERLDAPPEAVNVDQVLEIADWKFKSKVERLKTRTQIVQLAKQIAPLYGVDPAAILAAVLGEMTFNSEYSSLFQQIVAQLPGEALFTGAHRFATYMKDPAFAPCHPERRDYWSWVCMDRVWNFSAAIKLGRTRGLPGNVTIDIRDQSDMQPLAGVIRPVTGYTYGPAQMSLVDALMLSADVNKVSGGKFPILGPDNMSAALQAVVDPESAVHYAAAEIARSIDLYKRFSHLDISKNIGVLATLFNLGQEAAHAMENRHLAQEHKPTQMPRENYFGWYMNQHEAEIRALLN